MTKENGMSKFVLKIINLVGNAIRTLRELARTSPWSVAATVAIVAMLVLRVMP